MAGTLGNGGACQLRIFMANLTYESLSLSFHATDFRCMDFNIILLFPCSFFLIFQIQNHFYLSKVALQHTIAFRHGYERKLHFPTNNLMCLLIVIQVQSLKFISDLLMNVDFTLSNLIELVPTYAAELASYKSHVLSRKPL